MYDEFDGYQDDSWLLEHAERLLASELTTVKELVNCIKWLKDAIAKTRDVILERKYRTVRSRLFRELDERNRESADDVFVHCEKYLVEADEELAKVADNPGARNAFDRASERLLWTARGIGILRTKKYLIPFVAPRQSELDTFKERLAQLTRKRDELRPQVIAVLEEKIATEAAAKVAAEKARIEAERRVKEEAAQRIRQLYDDCSASITSGDLTSARNLLAILMKEEVELSFGANENGSRRPRIVPKPEVLELEQQFTEKAGERALELKAKVERCEAVKDGQGLLIALAALEQVDERGLAKAFMSVDQACMFTRRIRQRSRPAGKAGIRVMR